VDTELGELWLPADDQVMLPYLRHARVWEPAEERLLITLMTPRTRFLDVGAAIGYFSVLAARQCAKGTIDAVEPSPANLPFLRMNLWRYAPHATVWPVALGAERGVVGLDRDPHNVGNTRLRESGRAAGALSALARGDDLFAGRTFDLIKIDVQGFELDVLQGMEALIRRSRRTVVLAEFFPRAIQARGRHPLQVLGGYRALGLRPVASIDGRLEPLDDHETLALCQRSGPDGFVNLLLQK